MVVLIIDDSEFIRTSFTRLLLSAKLELNIEEAYDVPSGEKKIIELQPNIVIIDIRIPGGTGFDLIKFAKENSPKSKIIVLTNFANSMYREKSMDLGANFFFDKSTEFKKVIDIIKKEKKSLVG